MEPVPTAPKEVYAKLNIQNKFQESEDNLAQKLVNETILFWEPPLYYKGFFNFSTLLGNYSSMLIDINITRLYLLFSHKYLFSCSYLLHSSSDYWIKFYVI